MNWRNFAQRAGTTHARLTLTAVSPLDSSPPVCASGSMCPSCPPCDNHVYESVVRRQVGESAAHVSSSGFASGSFAEIFMDSAHATLESMPNEPFGGIWKRVRIQFSGVVAITATLKIYTTIFNP